MGAPPAGVVAMMPSWPLPDRTLSLIVIFGALWTDDNSSPCSSLLVPKDSSAPPELKLKSVPLPVTVEPSTRTVTLGPIERIPILLFYRLGVGHHYTIRRTASWSKSIGHDPSA